MKRSESCLNCGTPLEFGDNYCRHCGQGNDGRRLTFRELIAETLANLFSLDSRFYFTLRTLMSRPGLIAKDFVEGRRQRFVHPIRFYLSISLVFFLIQGVIKRATGDFDPIVTSSVADSDDSIKAPSAAAIIDSVMADSSLSPETQEVLAELDLDPNSPGSEIVIPIDESGKSKWTVDTTSESTIGKIGAFIETHRETPYKEGLDSLGLEDNFWNRWTYIEYQKFRNSDKETLIKYFLGKLPLTIFLFMPLFGLIFVPLYWRRGFHYIDHLVFIFYHQAYFFLLLLFAIIGNAIFGSSALLGGMLIYFFFYLFLSFKRFYGQGIGKTLLKFTIIQIFLLNMSAIFIILMSVVLFIFYQ
jgi:hypothetical protein